MTPPPAQLGRSGARSKPGRGPFKFCISEAVYGLRFCLTTPPPAQQGEVERAERDREGALIH